MKFLLTLDDNLHREIKIAAVVQGKSMQKIIEESIIEKIKNEKKGEN
jgi:predicted HicB family RNase H-like nuclease